MKQVKLWNLAANTVTDLAVHDAPIKSMAWVPEKGMLITGGWDATLKYWDPRAASATPVHSVALPDRVYSMDVKGGNMMVLGLADKQIAIFDLANPTVPYRTMESPLKLQTRTVKIFYDLATFAIGSIEGRVAIRCIDGRLDEERELNNPAKLKHSFAFKCHRRGAHIYPVNSIETMPVAGHTDVFVTAGSDGTFVYWDKKERRVNQEYSPCAGTQSISCAAMSPNGDMYAYACSYDWYKGSEHIPAVPTRLMVHPTQNIDVTGPPPGS